MDVFELLHASPSFAMLCAVLFGLAVGSFLNVVIYRLPKMMERQWRSECQALLDPEYLEPEGRQRFNLVTPGSHCPHCDHRIGAFENIPVVSYALQAGKCKNCNAKISIRYPFVELLGGVTAGYVIYHFGFGLPAVLAMFVTWALIALSAIDIDTQLLPDDITLPLLWAGLMVNTFGLFVDLQSAVFGAVFGYLALWSIYWAFKLATGKEGMGYGDFKLLAALGAWLGWQALPIIIIVSSLVGAVIGIAMIALTDQEKSQPIPFGPYLAIAGWLTLVGATGAIETFIFPTGGL